MTGPDRLHEKHESDRFIASSLFQTKEDGSLVGRKYTSSLYFEL